MTDRFIDRFLPRGELEAPIDLGQTTQENLERLLRELTIWTGYTIVYEFAGAEDAVIPDQLLELHDKPMWEIEDFCSGKAVEIYSADTATIRRVEEITQAEA